MLKKLMLTKKTFTLFGAILLVKVLVTMGTVALTLLRPPAFAQNTPDVPEPQLTQIASGLIRPVHITHAGDGSDRLFVVEQRGRIMVLDNEQGVKPFLDITDRVHSPASGGGNEQGLLGLAFPPGFANKGYFYVYYTLSNGDNVLSRFSLTDQATLADPMTEEQLLVFPHPQFQNHNGGQLAFGPDGYLYISTGDGGGGGDPLGNAQNPSSLNGKLLRIDVEMDAAKHKLKAFGSAIYWPYIWSARPESITGQTYLIPKDNPFIDADGFRPEIWALGLRNPWRFSFDPENGDLYIADVGQNRWEEINFQPAESLGGENYGWNIMEGEECYSAGNCNTDKLTLPAHTYPIFSSTECSITGGYVYRGDDISALEGAYIFGDFCSGKIWGLYQDRNAWESKLLTTTNFRISAFSQDAGGELYIADMAGGNIYKLTSN